jgi:hypothetical protein
MFLLACNTGGEQRQFMTYTIEQFFASSNVGRGVFSPDEKKLLIGSDETGISNLIMKLT